jgi:hypothetical protein
LKPSLNAEKEPKTEDGLKEGLNNPRESTFMSGCKGYAVYFIVTKNRQKPPEILEMRG